MSQDAVSPISSSNPPEAAAPAATTAPTKVNAEANASTIISSLTDFKAKAPKVYNMMMLSIAQNIVNEMHRHQEDLKKKMREGYSQ